MIYTHLIRDKYGDVESLLDKI